MSWMVQKFSLRIGSTSLHAFNAVGCVWGIVITIFAVSSPLVAQPNVIWTENFDRADWDDDWAVEGGTWQVGVPTSGPHGSFSEPNVAATILGGNYVENVDARLIRIARFTIPYASENPRLRFRHWYSFNAGDAGGVQFREADGNWESVAECVFGGTFTKYSNGWTHAFCEL